MSRGADDGGNQSILLCVRAADSGRGIRNHNRDSGKGDVRQGGKRAEYAQARRANYNRGVNTDSAAYKGGAAYDLSVLS